MGYLSDKSILTNQDTRYGFIFLSLIVVTLVSPGLAVVSMGILARGIFNEKIGRPILAYTLVGFLALFNATKRIDGDWSWYIDGYLEMSRMGLLDYLQEGGLSIRMSEPLYYAFSFVVSRMSGGNVFALALAVSLAVYLTYVFALEKLMKLYGLHRWAAAICIVFAVLAGLTFTQSINLVRQYVAGSVLFFFFVLILERRYKTAVILFVLGTLIHNSFIVPGSLLTGCVYLWSLPFVRRRYLSFILILVGCGYAVGSQITSLVTGSEHEVSAFLDNGEVSSTVFFMDILLFFISLAGIVLFRKSPDFFTKSSAIAVLFLALYGGMLVGGHELTLFFLRFYFYVEWFRIIGVITIVWYLVYRAKVTPLAMLIIPLSFIGLGFRVSRSEWGYGGDVFEHLTKSVIWWVGQINSIGV